MSLDASAIVASDDLKKEEIEVPEWGGSVFIRTLRGKEISVFSTLVKGEGDSQEFPIESVATVVALTLCNEAGERIFPDENKAVPILLEKNWSVLQRIFKRSLALSSMSTDDPDESPGKD